MGQTDQTTARTSQSAYGTGLDGDTAPPRLTFSSAMRALSTIMRADPTFADVSILEVYPEDNTIVPRVVWRLKSRVAGNQGINRKNPFTVEQVPLDNGQMLTKYHYPQTFEVAFEALASSSEEADTLRDDLEFWLMTHRPQTAQCGLESFIFLSEQEPEIVGGSSGTSSSASLQKIHKRTIYYTGVINYLYSKVEDTIRSFRSWRVGDTTWQTALLTRSALVTDLSPVPGPLALQCLHDDENLPQMDYVHGTDFVVEVNTDSLESYFQIRWLPRGRQPVAGASYFMTYLTALDSARPMLPENTRIRRAPHRVQGQAVDPRQTSTIASLPTGPHFASIAPSIGEALLSAQTEIVAVLDPALNLLVSPN